MRGLGCGSPGRFRNLTASRCARKAGKWVKRNFAIVLGKRFKWRKKKSFFESGGNIFRHSHNQMSGNPV
jgi:hypothetical protein